MKFRSLLVCQATCVTHVAMLVLMTNWLMPVSCDGARILLVVGNMNSHVIYFSRLAVELAQLGHVTRILVPSNARVPDFLSDDKEGMSANFTYTTYTVDGDEPYANSRQTSELLVRIALSDSFVEKFSLLSSFGEEVLRHWEADCVRLLDDQRLMDDLRASGYDFAVMDPAAIYCYYVVPHVLRIPYATMSIAMSAWMFRVPRLPSFASTTLGFTDRMTFTERLMSFAAEMAQLMTINETSYYADKYVPRESSSSTSSAMPLNELTMIQRSSLWFYMEDVAVGYPMPQMPNTVAIGDIMAGRPGRSLPVDLENFVAASDSGQAVVVSFGSYFDFIPEVITRQFCDAFVRLGSKFRVVWKVKNADVCSAVDNVKIVSWLPQNDLLADRRVRLFISHGGMNSLIEAVYHAKPVIVFPIALDQSYNAAAAVSKGYAIRMDLRNFTADSLLANIGKILSDRSYLSNARLASSFLKDRSETPAERVSRMIDHVIKYGDKHLRTGAFELNVLQFMMLDIFLCLFSVALGFVAGFISCCCCFYKLCVAGCLRRVIRKKKKD